MKVLKTDLPGVRILEPRIFKDNRGCFLETYHACRYSDEGLPGSFVQANVSVSSAKVLRGLHYQLGNPQGKLVTALSGEIFDVAVDIRQGSPTFGKWIGVHLSAENCRQLFIPEGFAHGFCVIADPAIVHYKCTDHYAPAQERGIIWNDRLLGIEWPISDPILSEKDCTYAGLAEMPPDQLPVFMVKSEES